jgi:hypothetical protein
MSHGPPGETRFAAGSLAKRPSESLASVKRQPSDLREAKESRGQRGFASEEIDEVRRHRREDRSRKNPRERARVEEKCRITLSTFSAITAGFALATASRPMALKSNEHSCLLACLCVEQYTNPHRHSNPVNPTRLLQL